MKVSKIIGRALAGCMVATMAILVISGPEAHGQSTGREPILMEGKKTLAKKVLMRPGASLSESPGGLASQQTAPFSVNFVYGEQSLNGVKWLEIGPDRTGSISGWVQESQTAEWRQSMTLAFTNPAGRERTLFFKDRDELENLLGSDELLVHTESFRQQIRRGNLPEDSPIISIEPENHIDLQKQFYLLPILEAEEIYLESGYPTTLLKISSISEEDPEGQEDRPEPPPKAPPLVTSDDDQPTADGSLRSAVTFVIDATTSMGPYIEQVREAVRETYKLIQDRDLSDYVRFGLVSYRDNVEAAPWLEYATRLFADPNTVSSADGFLEKIRGLTPAAESSKGFIEDAYSGIELALTSIDWADYAGRFLILVTDAGAREGSDSLSGTGMSTEQIRQLALSHNVFIYVIHLKTPQGQSDHQSATIQYMNLAARGDGSRRSLYFGIPAGDPEIFGRVVRDFGEQITEQIRAFREGRGRPEIEAKVEQARRDLEAAETEAERLDRGLKYDTALVGLAIRLAFVGEREEDRAPSMFSAWLTDRSFRDPDRAVVEVRVLLTKNQLSDLQETMQRVLDASETGQIAPDDFFSTLRAAAAAMGRSPDQISGAESITDLGLIGEYLDDLPYRSQVMNISQDIWTSWSIGQQQQFIDTIDSKIELYRRFHDNTENWVLLNPAAPSGEAVYPVPLDSLP